MKKNIFCVLMSVALLLSLVGCPDMGNLWDGENVTLDIMVYDNPEYTEFGRIAEEFMKKNPNIKVVYDVQYGENYHQKVNERLNAKDYPDIAYMGADARWGGPWKAAGQQIDNVLFMPDFIDQKKIPDFFGTGVKPYLPLGGSNFCTVVAVNMDLLNEINGGKLPATYDDLKTLAAACAAKGISCMTTHGADAWVWGSCVMSGIVPRYTSDTRWIEKACQGEVKFTDSAFVEALNTLKIMVTDGVLDSNSTLLDSDAGFSDYQNGKCLMYIDGQWSMSQSNLGTAKTKLIAIPAMPNEKYLAGAMAGAWQAGYGITKKGASDLKVLAAAKKFFEFFYSEKETITRIRNGAISSSILKSITLPDDIEPIVAEKGNLGEHPLCYVIDSYLSGTPNDLLNAGMLEIINGTKTAEQVAASVQAAFDAL